MSLTTRRAPSTGVSMIAPPACHALQETLSNRLSVIEIRQMAGIYSESAPTEVAVAGVENGYVMTNGKLRGGHAWHGGGQP